ncbi:MAG: glycosyltransferase family 39 protein [Armatimonadetes bacterium]|nr:glycosyltransferase family 39 protein [Armatimonadota bacterium]
MAKRRKSRSAGGMPSGRGREAKAVGGNRAAARPPVAAAGAKALPLWRGGSPGTRWTLGAILAVYFALGGLYLATVPFGHAPDEVPHLLYVQELAGGRLPVLRQEDRAGFEAHQPPLAYALALPAYLAAGGRAGEGDGAPRAAKYAVRVTSLLLGAVVVVLVFAGVRAWLPGNAAAAALAAMVAAFVPMRLAVFSSFSNDPLTEAVFTATLLLLLIGVRDGFDRRRSLLIGVLLGAGLLTKSTCALLFLVALLALFLEWRRHRTRAREYRGHAAAMVGVGLLIGGPWLARNVALYGDPFAWGVFNTFFADRAGPKYFSEKQGMAFVEYLRFAAAVTARSFWGVFDHANLWLGGPAPPRPGIRPDVLARGSADAPIYTLLNIMAFLLAGGAAAAAVRGWRPRAEWQRDVAATWSVCLALLIAAMARFTTTFIAGAQARYLYPGVLPITAAMALGWLALCPRRWRAPRAAVGGVLLAALAVYAWHGTLLRIFGKVGW